MMTMWRGRALAAAAVWALCFSGAATAAAGERYYLLIFGSQSVPKQLRYTHTWATVVRAVGEGTDPTALSLETLTISWLPRTLNIRVFAAHPEPGVNLELHPTILAMFANQETITMWGPFVCGPLLYNQFRQQIARLESGQVEYRAIDGLRNPHVSDCIHAVSDVDPEFGRARYPLIRIGIPASRHIVRNLMSRSRFDQQIEDHSWLIPRLGLDNYPITVIGARESPRLRFSPCPFF